jgi:hypothetical protein
MYQSGDYASCITNLNPQFISSPATIEVQFDRYLNDNEQWINEHLGVDRDQWEFLTPDYGYGSLYACLVYTLATIRWGKDSNRRFTTDKTDDPMAAKFCEATDGEVTEHPAIQWGVKVMGELHSKERSGLYQGAIPYGLCSLQLKAPAITLISIMIRTYDSHCSEAGEASRIIIRKSDLRGFVSFWEELQASVTERPVTLSTVSSGSMSSATVGVKTWESLVLDESIVSMVRRDVESFYKRKEWFAKNNLPFRRGYLFHGPPGNGKTSTIKALMSSMGMNGFTIRPFSPKASDLDVESVFEKAADAAPAFIVFEDLDRVFPKTGETKSPLSLQSFLNAIDGLSSQDGIIVIATANEPTALDKSILKRPGRFDRVVLFDNPSEALRLRYFTERAPYLGGDVLDDVVQMTAGFSFAQLQEVFIFGGQAAYEEDVDNITAAHLKNGAAILRKTTQMTQVKSVKSGFGVGE